ncbi:MAG: PTS sugar transporter subunit IIA [Mycobacteriaceae bacterium]|nr:PTS sugar transporter subunit IIA [Mycobacteriaceae bacterium]
MKLSEILQPNRVIAGLRVRDKAHLTAELSRSAGAALSLEPRLIETALNARERLGSTGLGRGFALPHTRLSSLDRCFGLFVRLARPIAFDAIDGQPVDLVFMLLIPESGKDGHVTALAAVSRRMRDQAVAQQLRKATSSADLYNLLTSATA